MKFRFPRWPLVVIMLAASMAHAQPAALIQEFPTTSLGRQRLSLEVLDEQGTPLSIQIKHGRPVVVLGPGRSYRIRLTNLIDERVCVVVSVAGLNPSSGKPAVLGQPCVVLQPMSTTQIKRAKPSPRGEAAPVMPMHGRSAAIALAVFAERQDYPTQMPGVKAAPFSPEYFRKGPMGRHWMPPPDYPFRKRSTTPAESIYLEYEVPQGCVEAPACSSLVQ